jgi:hypothetical protein
MYKILVIVLYQGNVAVTTVGYDERDRADIAYDKIASTNNVFIGDFKVIKLY